VRGLRDELLTATNDDGKLRPLGNTFCPQYQTQAHFFIEAAEPNDVRHLVVQYANGRRECRVGLPREWTDDRLLNLVLLNPLWEGLSYPVWEHSDRYFANSMLTWPPEPYCYVRLQSVAHE